MDPAFVFKVSWTGGKDGFLYACVDNAHEKRVGECIGSGDLIHMEKWKEGLGDVRDPV